DRIGLRKRNHGPIRYSRLTVTGPQQDNATGNLQNPGKMLYRGIVNTFFHESTPATLLVEISKLAIYRETRPYRGSNSEGRPDDARKEWLKLSSIGERRSNINRAPHTWRESKAVLWLQSI